jgi:hypothetical protein
LRIADLQKKNPTFSRMKALSGVISSVRARNLTKSANLPERETKLFRALVQNPQSAIRNPQ